MKDLYSIGETAKILGVTVQTLRYYSKTYLLQPKYIDPATGYRYYSFDQFHYIDRIKYLQSFGIPLANIQEVIQSGSVEKLIPILEEQRQKSIQQLKETQEIINDIEWYIKYFKYLKNNDILGSIYKVKMEERYVVKVPCYEDEPLQNMEMRLIEIKYSHELKHLRYLRQFGYTIDLNKFMDKKFSPESIFMYLKNKPDIDNENIMIIPSGEYLCFQVELLTERWDPYIIKDYLKKYNRKPVLVIANEYEDNLKEYTNAVYEIQILI